MQCQVPDERRVLSLLSNVQSSEPIRSLHISHLRIHLAFVLFLITVGISVFCELAVLIFFRFFYALSAKYQLLPPPKKGFISPFRFPS